MKSALDKLGSSAGLQSLFGLTVFFIMNLIGAAIFRELELPREIELATAYAAAEAHITDMLSKHNAANPEESHNKTQAVALLMKQAQAKQPAPLLEKLNWTFSGSFFFVFTLMTTIGYGTFAPVTPGGMATVVWLGVILLAIGSMTIGTLAKGIDTATEAIVARIGKDHKALRSIFLFIAWSLISAGLFQLNLGVGFGTSVYYSFVTFTTIGLGDYAIWYGISTRGTDLIWFTLVTVVGVVLFSTALGQLCEWVTASVAAALPLDLPKAEPETPETPAAAVLPAAAASQPKTREVPKDESYQQQMDAMLEPKPIGTTAVIQTWA